MSKRITDLLFKRAILIQDGFNQNIFHPNFKSLSSRIYVVRVRIALYFVENKKYLTASFRRNGVEKTKDEQEVGEWKGSQEKNQADDPQ